MEHANWIAQARAHWKEHRPQAFKRMQADGTLQQNLEQAATATSDAMHTLMGQGYQAHEAWEMVREQHLFPPEEPGASPEAPVSDAYATAVAINSGWNALRMPGEPDD
jgi:hypothetical protein